MQKVEVTRKINAPPQAVWDIYVDNAGWHRWAGVRRSTLEVQGFPDSNGPGAVRCVGSFGFNSYEQVIEMRPPVYMAYQVVGGMFPIKNHRGEVLMEPEGSGTKITWRCRFEPMMPGTGWLLAAVVRITFATMLTGLGKYLARH
ncbi:MAG: SRPBCC family protein [Smithellaceae bacterium]|nr:SRPBCC family protein [Smithellaceae bacterium]